MKVGAIYNWKETTTRPTAREAGDRAPQHETETSSPPSRALVEIVGPRTNRPTTLYYYTLPILSHYTHFVGAMIPPSNAARSIISPSAIAGFVALTVSRDAARLVPSGAVA